MLNSRNIQRPSQLKKKGNKHAELQRTALIDNTAKNYFRILLYFATKNGNSFHYLKKKKKRDGVIKFQAYQNQK